MRTFPVLDRAHEIALGGRSLSTVKPGRASGRLGVDEPKIGMKLNTRVEESDERPGKPVNVFVFE
jgi:hypothetical protein